MAKYIYKTFNPFCTTISSSLDVDEVDNVHVEGASNLPAENAGEGRLRAGSQVEGGTETLLPAEQEADAELKAAEDQDATDQ